jgi:hypothetical protein
MLSLNCAIYTPHNLTIFDYIYTLFTAKCKGVCAILTVEPHRFILCQKPKKAACAAFPNA